MRKFCISSSAPFLDVRTRSFSSFGALVLLCMWICVLLCIETKRVDPSCHRLLERMRRFVAHAYELPLESLSLQSAFVSRIQAHEAADRLPLHCDEGSNSARHYSAVLYLTSQGQDFEGGDLVFSDDAYLVSSQPAGVVAEAAGPRRHSRYSPVQGSAVVFSSGWENLHFVDHVRSGTRFAVPVIFTTCTRPPKPPIISRWLSSLGRSLRATSGSSELTRAAALWRHVLGPETESEAERAMTDWHSVVVGRCSCPSLRQRR